MTFNPRRPYILTSIFHAGLSGKTSILTIQNTGRALMASSMHDKLTYSHSVSRKNALLLEAALSAMDFSILSHEDAAVGNDLSMWSVRLVQGTNEWEWSVRTDRVEPSSLAPLRAALTAIAVDLKSS